MSLYNNHSGTATNTKSNSSLKYIAFIIAFAIFFSPLQVPLSDITISESEDGKTIISVTHNAQELHVAQNDPAPSHNTKTYTKGKPQPDIVTATPAPLLAPYQTVDSIAIYATNTTQIAINNKKTPRTKTTHTNNVLAAEQVAAGTSASELVSVTLDDNENIVATTDIHGSKTTAEYNANGAPVRIHNADGTTNFYSYDINGNLTNIYREQTHAESVATNHVQKFFSAITHPLWAFANTGDTNTEEISINYSGNHLSNISNGSTENSFEYNDRGLITRELRPDGSVVDYNYDELGNTVETIETPAEPDTILSFRSFFSLSIASVLPLSLGESSEYNDKNQLISYKITPDNREITPEDTTTSTLVIVSASTTAPEPAATTTSEIVATTTTPKATTTPTSTPESSLSAPQLETATTTSAPETSTTTSIFENIVSWARGVVYSAPSSLAGFFSLSYAETPDEQTSTTTAATTDTNTNIDSSTTKENTPNEPVFDLSFNYDLQGNLIETHASKGLLINYSYNNQTNTLQSQNVVYGNSTLTTTTYQTDSNARVIGNNTNSFTYSVDNMLIGDGENIYNYDESGNRLATNNIAYTYTGNRLESASYNSGRKTNFTYGARGEVSAITDTQTGSREFTYTPDGSIANITTPNNSITYTYDGLGRRTSRDSQTEGITTYTYTGAQLKKVARPDGQILREYFYTPTKELVAVKMDGILYHVITDRSHSITGLVNSVTGEYFSQTYDVWGKITASTFPKGFDLGYVGAFLEASLNYSILGPRVYDPEIGRFLSKDPLPGVILDSLSQNEYIYAKNDPANQYDPTGHASELSENSNSPKRALIETKQAIQEVRSQLEPELVIETELEKAVLDNPNDTEIATALVKTQIKVSELKSAIANLHTIETIQNQAIYENEHPTIEPDEVSAPAPVLFAVPVATATEVVSTSTENTATNTPTAALFLPASTTISSTSQSSSPVEAIPTNTEGLNDSEIPKVESDSIIDTDNTSSQPLSYLGAATLAFATYLDSHLLKAEAKKKAAPKKKAKPAKKVSAKAKKAHEKETKKLAQVAKNIAVAQKALLQVAEHKLSSLQQQLVVAKSNKAAAATKQAQTKPKATLATLESQTKVVAASITKSPAVPKVNFATNLTGAGSTSSGISNSTAQFVSSDYKAFSLNDTHIALTACGFEPTIFGLSCGIADGILYLYEGKKGDASLSFVAAVPVVGTMGDIAKAGRAAEEVARVAKAAKAVQAIKTISLANLPTNVQDAYRLLSSKNWQTGVGVGEGVPSGGRFANTEGILPSQSDLNYYREFGVNPRTAAGNDTERFVVGKSNEVYYTNNHYGQINNGELPFRLIK